MKTDQKSPENASLAPFALERHQGALQRYAARLLGHDTVRAREVVEATFAELKSQPAEEVEDELPEWLFAECRKRAFAVLQREGRMKRFEAGDSEGAAASGPGPGEGSDSEEAHVTMQRLIDRLTPKQQEAMRLKFQDGFGHKEIARITDLSPTNVSLVVHNAVARLGREFRAQRPAAEAGENPMNAGDDPRLTLYALGEMEDDERRNFESSLFDKKTAGARVDEIRATGSLIGKTLAIEAGAPAPRPVRRKKGKRRRGPGLWFRFPRILFLLAGAAVAVGLALYFMQRKTETAPAAAAATVDFSLKAAPWEEQPAAADASTQPDHVSDSGGAADLVGSLAGMRPHKVHPPVMAPVVSGAAAPEMSLETDENEDGVPTGPVSSEVSAVARGKNGEAQFIAEAAAPGGVEAGAVPIEERSETKPEAQQPQSDPKTAKEAKPDAKSHGPGRQLTSTGGAKAEREKRNFKSPEDAPISQVPVDADTASVIDLKRWLGSGRLPRPGSVKVEAMLNYFPFNYPAPAAPEDFAPAFETSEAPWAPSHRLVRVGLKGREASSPLRAAANLVLLIDTSGSMAAPNRLPLVKEAARLLLGHLRPDDRVGIVTYAGESRLTLLPTPVAETRKIRDALDRLEAGGMTNGGAGLELAYDLAKAHVVPDGVNCVILCTDGDFNVGETSEADLTRLIDRQAKSSVQLSIFGFGRNGRIDPRLEALASHGRGGSGYVNTRREAEQVLTAQLNGLFEPLAKNVKVEVAFNPAAVKSYHLIGYDDANGAPQTAGARSLPSGTVLPGHTLTALYEVEPADHFPPGAELLKLRVSYEKSREVERRQLVFLLRDRPEPFAAASLDFKFAAAVAAFGTVLNDPPEKGPEALELIEAWGRECLGDDAGGYRSEFLSLVEQARAARQ